MTLHEALVNHRVSGRVLANGIGMSKTQTFRLLHDGIYPARITHEEVRARISTFLSEKGVPAHAICWPGEQTSEQTSTEPHKEAIELMQLDRAVLQLFGLRTNPFVNDIESEADVLRFRGYETVEQAIKDTINERAFLAITGESGSGKTTIWDGIESELEQRGDTIICKPLMKSKEKMTPEHLARALIYGLAGDDIRIRVNAEDRGRQLSSALRNIREGGVDRKAVLYIDDAHFCSPSVLRQLKTFYEEKVGRYRLLAIVLVGLPTLKSKLAEFAEVGNRIRLIEVPPVEVGEYLTFKLQRAGADVGKLFDKGGLDAFLDRFRVPRRPALGRPLLINAMCIRAMCRLHSNGAAPGERITREIVDQIPGESATRKAA